MPASTTDTIARGYGPIHKGRSTVRANLARELPCVGSTACGAYATRRHQAPEPQSSTLRHPSRAPQIPQARLTSKSRVSVPITTGASPARSRASRRGSAGAARLRRFSPALAATRWLERARRRRCCRCRGPLWSSASTVAAAASSRWMNDQTPPPPPTIGKLSGAHSLDESVIAVAVQVAVAQRDPAGVGDHLVQILHRSLGWAHRRHGGRVERILLGLDRSALTRVPVAGEALGDEAVDAGCLRGGEQRVGALGTQPVGLGEAAVEVLEVVQAGQRSCLVDDRVRFGLDDGLAHRGRVEEVEHDRLRTQRARRSEAKPHWYSGRESLRRRSAMNGRFGLAGAPAGADSSAA